MLKDQWPPDKWLPVSIAPSDADLEVSVMDKRGIHALVFPVRKSGIDWVDASTKNASTSGRHIGANGLTAARLISLRFILIVGRQLFLLCLLLGEKAPFHCSLCRIGFCFQQFFEPVDIRLDDPSQMNSRVPAAAYCRLRLYGRGVEGSAL